jgi:hypothetical protein
MRVAMRLVAVIAVCAGVGVVGAPVAGAADTRPPTAPSNVRRLWDHLPRRLTWAVRAVDQAGNRSDASTLVW